MARIRTIKPEFWTDEKVVELSPLARLLFIGLWNFADDDGRMVYSPTRIKLQILPADSTDISALLGEIRGKSLIEVYAVDGVEYLQISSFAKHQKVDKRTPSKYPAPAAPSAESPRVPPTEGNGREGNKGIVGKPDDLQDQAISVLDYLNEKAGRGYRPVEANIRLITARLKEGATVEDCRAVIERKCEQWAGGDFEQYLRPATLFNATNFAQYQGEKAKPTVRVDL